MKRRLGFVLMAFVCLLASVTMLVVPERSAHGESIICEARSDMWTLVLEEVSVDGVQQTDLSEYEGLEFIIEGNRFESGIYFRAQKEVKVDRWLEEMRFDL